MRGYLPPGGRAKVHTDTRTGSEQDWSLAASIRPVKQLFLQLCLPVAAGVLGERRLQGRKKEKKEKTRFKTSESKGTVSEDGKRNCR